jgi:methylmalonyl-CoA mutase cobalamin-binding subunit
LIERVVYEVTLANRRPVPLNAPRALIAVTPDDQHSFGAVVLSEILRAAGWFVLTRLDSTTEQLCADVAADRFGLIGLSLSRTSRIANLRDTIGLLRRQDGGRHARYLVGGRVFTTGEAQAVDVGADFMAVDPPEAIRLLDDVLTFVAAD